MAYHPGEHREEYLTRPLSYKSNYRWLTIFNVARLHRRSRFSLDADHVGWIVRIGRGENYKRGTPLIELAFDFRVVFIKPWHFETTSQ